MGHFFSSSMGNADIKSKFKLIFCIYSKERNIIVALKSTQETGIK